MVPEVFKESIDLGDGKIITIETGKLAKQADGSVVVRCGNAVLLATVVSSKTVDLNMDFLPLTVDYREKFASAGRFPGGFFKREARPSDGEILTMRLVDRVLRPLFPKNYHAETQVMIQLMSHDEDIMPDAMAGLAASTCIALSDIPFECEISEVRIGRIDGKYIVNPSKEALKSSDMEIMVGASFNSITMVEGEMNEVSEKDLIEAIKVAHDAIKIQCVAQQNLVKKAGGKKPTRTYDFIPEAEEFKNKIRTYAYDKFYEITKTASSKQEYLEKSSEVITSAEALFSEEELAENRKQITSYSHAVKKEAIRNLILEEGLRLDGRKTTEIRPIWCEVNYLPSTHGSAIFTRGETQALATVTLGTSRDVNIIDKPSNQSEERFYLHYNFPPFSTGEARPLRGTSRREVGHGNLAQRALKVVIPEECPYTIRIVSEILESNGSSSMATICAGTLALMDAGIQISKPVSGIAMGLITDGAKFAVLSDILGDEDFLGDMDFKVAGTQDGITACQMDIKIKDLTYEILEAALEQSKEGRLHILDKIVDTLSSSEKEVKLHAPKIKKIEIPKEYIGSIIGPSGKNIQALQEQTKTTIVINEVDNMGIVEIMGTDPEGMHQALESVKNSTFELQVGEVYKGKVIKLLDFGAVIEFVPGKECLLHISEIAHERIENVAEVVHMGDSVEVKYLGIDPRTKKQKISRKALLPKS